MGRRTRKNRTNDEWVAALRGDTGREAQRAAYQDLADYLYKVSYNYLLARKNDVPGLRSKSDAQLADLAEDLTWTTVAEVARKQLYAQYRGEGRFMAYMAKIAINEIRQELRLKKWQISEEPLPPPEPELEVNEEGALPPLQQISTSELGPEHQQELQALWDAIRQCVGQLPERWRRAFIMKVFEDRPASEVKEYVNASSDSTVHLLVSRARSRLKKCLANAGWNLSEVWQLFDR